MEYKFKFDEKEYILGEDNLEYFANDENEELEGIDGEKILELLSNSDEVEFQNAYYESCCSNCKAGKEEKKKVFDFFKSLIFMRMEKIINLLQVVSIMNTTKTFH